jgi:hypothetical protein
MGFILDSFFTADEGRVLWRDLRNFVSPPAHEAPLEFVEPPKEGEYASFWREAATAIDGKLEAALRDNKKKAEIRNAAWQFANVLEKWDKEGRSNPAARGAISAELIRRFQVLRNLLPLSVFPLDDRQKWVQKTTSVLSGIMVRVESGSRNKDFKETMKEFALAHAADSSIQPEHELRLDPHISPGAYWKAKDELIPAALKDINGKLLKDLQTLEDPSSGVTDRISALEGMLKHFDKWKEQMSALQRASRGDYGTGNPGLLTSVLAETVRGVTSPPPGSAAPGRNPNKDLLLTIGSPDLLTPARDKTMLRDRELKVDVQKGKLVKQNELLRKAISRRGVE